MRRYAFVLMGLLLPLLVFAEVRVSWMPQAGISYSWADGGMEIEELRFYPGISGGVMAEIKMMDWFGIKTGIEVSQLAVQNDYLIPGVDMYGNPLVSLVLNIRMISLMAQAPITAMFYMTPMDNLEAYGGIGVLPCFNGYQTDEYFDEGGNMMGAEYFSPWKYYTAFTVDAGVHWNVGPGKMTMGLIYAFYNMSSSGYKYYKHNIRIYAGYIF